MKNMMRFLSLFVFVCVASLQTRAVTHTYTASADFGNLSSGEVPYYVEGSPRFAMAINAANTSYRDKFAKASVSFTGTAGTYDIAITALKEIDGECSYRLSVNGVLIGTRQNNSTSVDYDPQEHIFKGVTVPAGALLEVESNTHTNGEIPEGNGTAWARGRWTTLTLTTPPAVAVTGELKRWHNITLTLDGPSTSETASPNPFTDYRMNVEFTHPASGTSLLVPGYFAADGNAANSSATSGNKWRAHLAPNLTGTWNYTIKFRSGSNVAVDLNEWAGNPVFPFNNTSGNFTVTETDKADPDFRYRGRLIYDGSRYLKHAATGGAFIKTGADAPENFLNYTEFDNTYNHGANYLRTWTNHVADWTGSDPTWGGNKGKGIIGAINYLASEGQNVFSFLTYNAGGDSKDVWPFTSHTNPLVYDCSKLDQWEIVFTHGQNKGMYLHFKMQERENDDLSGPGSAYALDDGNMGNERKLYFRELVARFGHHLALNWNMGEENSQSTSQQQDMFQYMADIDPYQSHRVLHTYPNEWEQVYRPLLGSNSEMLGVSLQCNYAQVHSRTIQWINESDVAGKPWVVANDEQGPANYANPPDSVTSTTPSQKQMRDNVVWGNLMAGGAGIELYAGYQNPHSDLTLTDFRSRDQMWDYCRFAKQFFYDHLMFSEMESLNSLIGNGGNNNNKYCFGKTDSKYAIYLPSGGTTTINLSAASGTFKVWWFDARNGGGLQAGTVSQVNGGGSVSVGNAPNNTGLSWAVLLCRDGEENVGEGSATIVPVVDAGADTYILLPTNVVALTGTAQDQDGTVVSYQWTQESGPNTAALAGATTNTLTASSLVAGDYVFRLTATDNDGGSGFDEVRVTVLNPANTVAPTAEGGPNQTIQLPTDQLTIDGTASDDSHYSVLWTQDAGPSTAALSGQTSEDLTASSLLEGDYVFRITVTDIEGNEASDTVSVKVLPLGSDGAWIESGGMVVIEPEHGDLVTSWVARPSNYGAANSMAGSLGSGWLEWTGGQTSGNTKTEAQVDAIITYKFQITTAGDYFFRWRTKQYDNVPSGDAGNDSFVSMSSGSPVSGYQDFGQFHKVWVQSQQSWSWQTTFEPHHGTHYANNTVRRHYEAGLHTIKIARRSPGHAIDRIVLHRTTIPFNQASFESASESNRDGGGTPFADAGVDQSISAPASTASLNGSGTDTDGTVVGYEWRQVSGPTSATLSGITNETLQVSGLVQGTYTFELTVTDDEGKTGSDTADVTVIDDRVPTITTTTLPDGEVNSAYDQTIAFQNGQAPFTWSIVSGAIPSGLSFSNGRLHGTPTVNQVFNFTVRIEDTDGDLDEQAYSLTIAEESFEETKVFTAIHDAYIQGTSPFNTSELRIEAGNRVSYLMFEVSGITDDVTSAQLTLRCAGDGGNGTIRIYEGSHTTWTETTLTNANKPGNGAEVGSRNGTFSTGTSYDFDVTGLLNGAGDGTYTLIAQMDGGGNDAWFSSKEGTIAPTLTVTYDLNQSTPPPTGALLLFEEDFSSGAYGSSINGADWNPKWQSGTDQQNLFTGNTDFGIVDTSIAIRNYHAPSKHGFRLGRGEKAVIRSDFRYVHEAGVAPSNHWNEAAFGLLLGVAPNWWQNGGHSFALCNRGDAMGNAISQAPYVEGWVPHNTLGVNPATGGTSDWFRVEVTVERGLTHYQMQANIFLANGTSVHTSQVHELSLFPNGEIIYPGYTTGYNNSTSTILAISQISQINVDNFQVELIPETSALPVNTALWEEDFESLAPGTTALHGQTLGSELVMANTLSSEVVVAPPEFTNATGNVVLLSTSNNTWAGFRPTANPIDLSGMTIETGDVYRLSFDLYIPSSLAVPVGSVSMRWKDASNTGNGPSSSEHETAIAGVHHIEYTGTFPVDAGAGPFIPTEVRPLIFFDQNANAATNHVYLDNLELEITTGPELTGYALFSHTHGLTSGKLGDDDGDGELNFHEFASFGNPTNQLAGGVKTWVQFDESGVPWFFSWQRMDRESEGLVYQIEGCSELAGNLWTNVAHGLSFTNDIPGTVEMEEILQSLGTNAPPFVRLRMDEE